MNLRLLLALACAVTLAGWLASTALAHHPEIRGSVDCQGTVTFTAEAWTDTTSRPCTHEPGRPRLGLDRWRRDVHPEWEAAISAATTISQFSGTYNVALPRSSGEGARGCAWEPRRSAQAGIPKLTKGSRSTRAPRYATLTPRRRCSCDVAGRSGPRRQHYGARCRSRSPPVVTTSSSRSSATRRRARRSTSTRLTSRSSSITKTQLFSAGNVAPRCCVPGLLLPGRLRLRKTHREVRSGRLEQLLLPAGSDHPLVPRRHERVHARLRRPPSRRRRARPRR